MLLMIRLNLVFLRNQSFDNIARYAKDRLGSLFVHANTDKKTGKLKIYKDAQR